MQATEHADFDQQLDAYAQRARRRKGRRGPAELLGYTAAAGGLAFAGGDAMAAIVHFNTAVSVSWKASTSTTSFHLASWNINGQSGVEGFLFAGNPGVSSLAGGIVRGSVFAATGDVLFLGASFGFPFASRVSASNSVISTESFLNQTSAALGVFVSSTYFGDFVNTTGYVGLMFQDAATPGWLFGWAKVGTELNPGAGFAKVTVFEWAYEDSGAPIHIPDRSSSVPVPGTPLLTLLGLGAMGLRSYRRRRADGLKRLAETQAEA